MYQKDLTFMTINVSDLIVSCVWLQIAESIASIRF